MADQQGTGKHPHKSAADPQEHHEAATTKGASHTESKSESHSTSGSHTKAESTSHTDGQGTGKHPHKSASDPQEHHEGAKASSAGHSGGEHTSAKSGSTATHSKAESETHSGEQGTGKHPHKKASDPKEHHEGAKASK